MTLNVFFILVLCLLLEHVTALLTWARDSDLDFSFYKFVHLSFKCKLDTTYTISDTCIPHSDSHKELELILSENLCWDKLYKAITAHAYKVLGLICCDILSCHLTSAMVRPNTSLVQSQLLYCTQIWHPQLMKDILNIEHIQCCVTNYILNDYASCYKPV